MKLTLIIIATGCAVGALAAITNLGADGKPASARETAPLPTGVAVAGTAPVRVVLPSPYRRPATAAPHEASAPAEPRATEWQAGEAVPYNDAMIALLTFGAAAPTATPENATQADSPQRATEQPAAPRRETQDNARQVAPSPSSAVQASDEVPVPSAVPAPPKRRAARLPQIDNTAVLQGNAAVRGDTARRIQPLQARPAARVSQAYFRGFPVNDSLPSGPVRRRW